MMVRGSLGRECAAARVRAGLLAQAVAARAGVSESTISRLENGTYLVEDVEVIVETYEVMCGLPDGELWRRAIAGA